MNEFFNSVNWSAIANIATLIGTGVAVISSIKSIETKIESRAVEDRVRSDARFQANDAKFLAIDNRLDTLYQMFIDLLKDKKKGE